MYKFNYYILKCQFTEIKYNKTAFTLYLSACKLETKRSDKIPNDHANKLLHLHKNQQPTLPEILIYMLFLFKISFMMVLVQNVQITSNKMPIEINKLWYLVGIFKKWIFCE